MASILVVDDDPAIRLLLGEVLGGVGHQVQLSPEGRDAVARLAVDEFDLVITDLHMDEVDGIGVLRAAKKRSANTEVLILTGHGSIRSAVAAMQLGACEYLTKPVDLKELRLKVDKALERRELKHQLDEQRRKIEAQQEMIARDLKLAEQVQQSLVPERLENALVEIEVQYQPMIGVGGDFADIHFDGAEKVYLTMLDVTGHGITAALLVNRVCTEIGRLVREELEPREIISSVNDFILESFEGTGMFLTMFTAVLNLKSGSLRYSGCAHPPVIIWKSRSNLFEKLESQNPIVGYEQRNSSEIQQDVAVMSSHDKLIVYTDGIIEAENDRGKPLGLKGLIKFIRPCIYLRPKEVGETFMRSLRDFSASPLHDDVYLIVAELK